MSEFERKAENICSPDHGHRRLLRTYRVFAASAAALLGGSAANAADNTVLRKRQRNRITWLTRNNPGLWQFEVPCRAAPGTLQ